MSLLNFRKTNNSNELTTDIGDIFESWFNDYVGANNAVSIVTSFRESDTEQAYQTGFPAASEK